MISRSYFLVFLVVLVKPVVVLALLQSCSGIEVKIEATLGGVTALIPLDLIKRDKMPFTCANEKRYITVTDLCNKNSEVILQKKVKNTLRIFLSNNKAFQSQNCVVNFLLLLMMMNGRFSPDVDNIIALESLNFQFDSEFGEITSTESNDLIIPILKIEVLRDEIVDWLDTSNAVITRVPRPLVHKFNLLHRGIGAILVNPEGEIFLHRRSDTKQLFPSK